ncbi:YeeE/YedE thiosulfate transporter family protein [Desulfoluna limicola]|nr:YeeE/YedE thiosulfate transporter family protein [Desulfoluna limicola]
MNAKKKAHAPMPQKAYLNPYYAGFMLGITLLLSYLLLGTGLGASSGVARLGAALELTVAPVRTLASDYFGLWGQTPLRYYLVYMLVGVFFGGLISALLANRCKITIERGAACAPEKRLLFALTGGFLAGFASRLANGCTSGQALSGSAVLLVGSLLFLICIFVGGFATAWFVRRQWDD